MLYSPVSTHLKKIILSILFFLSRIVFINTQPVFFDSPEYISRITAKNFHTALFAGHWPYHFGYIFLNWPLFQLGKELHLNGLFLTLLFQVVFSYLTIVWFYKSLKRLLGQEIALKSSVIFSLTPLFWITNSTVMIETSYISFFIGSFYLLLLYLEKKEKKFLCFSAFLFGFAFFVNPVILLWSPVFLYLILKYKRNAILYGLIYLSFLFVFILFEALLISDFGRAGIGLMSIFKNYVIKSHEIYASGLDLHSFLVYTRNFIIPLIRDHTFLLTVLSAVSLFVAFIKKEKNIFIFGLLFVLPSVLANQWSDSLFYGREGLISLFGLSLLVGLLLQSRKLFTLFLCYLLIVSLPMLWLLRQPIPYIEEATMVKSLPKSSFLFESHYARPQVSPVFGDTID